MKRVNGRISLFLGIIIFIIFISSSVSKAYEERCLFDNIIKQTHGKVVECGLICKYITYINKESEIDNTLNKLGIKYSDYRLVKKDSRTYFIKFENDNLCGYIESIKQKNYYNNTLNIKIKKNKEELLVLNNIAKKIKNSNECKVCKYVKAKINEDNLCKLNNSIIDNLKKKSIYNIETIKLNNGYSTTAYTTNFNDFKDIYSDNRNLNYALCRYYSGNYIIIATPEILISY